jgi:hypothetical protein
MQTPEIVLSWPDWAWPQWLIASATAYLTIGIAFGRHAWRKNWEWSQAPTESEASNYRLNETSFAVFCWPVHAIVKAGELAITLGNSKGQDTVKQQPAAEQVAVQTAAEAAETARWHET